MAAKRTQSPQDRVSPHPGMVVSLEINKRLLDADRWRLLHAIPDLEWRSVEETVLEHIESATQYSTDDNVAREHGSLAYYAGQVAALRLLLASLETLRDRGGKFEE